VAKIKFKTKKKKSCKKDVSEFWKHYEKKIHAEDLEIRKEFNQVYLRLELRKQILVILHLLLIFVAELALGISNIINMAVFVSHKIFKKFLRKLKKYYYS
jgi:hypothetical protein